MNIMLNYSVQTQDDKYCTISLKLKESKRSNSQNQREEWWLPRVGWVEKGYKLSIIR